MAPTVPPRTTDGIAAPAAARVPTGSRLAVWMPATRPMLRALARTPGLAVAVLAGVPILQTIARGGTDLGVASVAAALIGGAAVGGAVEDVAGSTLGASPTSLLTRRAIRLGLIVAVVGVVLGIDAAAARLVDLPIGAFGPLAALGAAAAGLALAVASWLARNGEGGAGISGAVTAALLVLTSSALAMQYPWFPTLVGSESTQKWWLIAAVAWTAAAWLNRDPAARRRHLLPARH